MQRRNIRKLVSTVVIVVTLLVMAQTISAATFVNNTTAGGKPTWLNPGWQFTASSDTAFGDSVCIEVHPVGDAGNYVRTECAFAGGVGPFNFTCTVFGAGVPAAFQTASVEYQLYNDADADNCEPGGGGSNYTGFNWTFSTGPTPITLADLSAVGGAASSLPLAATAGASALAALGAGFLAWRRRK